MLKYVSLGYETAEIGYYAFAYCDVLTAVKIGSDYLKQINTGAFYYCDRLTDVYYAGSADDWGKTVIGQSDNDPLINATIHYYHSIGQ